MLSTLFKLCYLILSPCKVLSCELLLDRQGIFCYEAIGWIERRANFSSPLSAAMPDASPRETDRRVRSSGEPTGLRKDDDEGERDASLGVRLKDAPASR